MGDDSRIIVERPRLAERLDASITGRLTLLVAGAGYGKTTLLRSWAATRPVAWHTVGPADRMPGALAGHVIDALRLRIPDLSADLLVAASRSRGLDTDEASRAEAYAAALAEALDPALRRPTVLVLDDVHEIEAAPEAARLVAALIRQAPAYLHLVVASRDLPPFRTARMLAHGEATRIGAGDLAFSAEETADLVAAALPEPDPALAAAIHSATGGWPVATALALQAVAGAPVGDRDAIVRTVREPAGILLDYMAEEVIARESPRVLDLLRRIEPLSGVDADLAAAIGVPKADRALAEAARRGVYLEPVPNHVGRMRLTPLFASFIRSRHPLSTVQRRDVLATAARWHEQAGDHADALGYVAQLDDPVVCRRLLSEHGPALVAAGHARAVVDAAERLPEGQRDATIEAVTGEAWLLLGEWDRALACYQRAVPRDAPTPAVLAWRIGLLHYLRGELDDALKAYSTGDPADPDLAGRALMLGWAASAHWVRGDLEGCRTLAQQAHEAARASGDHRALANSHTVLAMVAALDGDRDANDAHYLKALDHAAAARDVHQLVRIHSNRSSRHLEEGDPEASIAEADVAIRLADLAGFASWRALALTNRGQALLLLGRLDEAFAELEAARGVWEGLAAPMAAYPYAWLGDLHQLRGDRAAARAAYERAITLAERVDDAQGLVPALTGLARLVAADEPQIARDLVRRALAYSASLYRVRALLADAATRLTWGEHDVAATRAAEAADEARARRDRASLAEAYEIVAAARRDREAARTAVDLWRQLRNPIGAARAAVILAELDGAAGKQGGSAPSLAFAHAAQAAEQAQAAGAREVAARARALLADLRRAEPPDVAIECLGGFRVVRRGEPVPANEWQSRKARDLVKLLVSRRGRPIHREQILELLWPDDDPARTANRLSVAASTVRTVFDPTHANPPDHYLKADGDVLSLNHVVVDVDRFLDSAQVGLTLARSGEHAAAREYLNDAELSYAGDLFEDDPYADWMVDLREKARLTYLEVARWLADDAGRRGDRDAQARYLLRILERDPYDEPAHLDLVTLLARAGRHGEARRRYQLYTRCMDEIDVEAAPYPSVGKS